jgi:hypothetical protein
LPIVNHFLSSARKIPRICCQAASGGIIHWWLPGRRKRPDRLGEVVHTLAKQAEGLHDGVACISHPEATVPLVQAVTALTAVPIVADSVERALTQWRRATHTAAVVSGNDGGANY